MAASPCVNLQWLALTCQMHAAECCIFHKRRQFGDWSDDEDSDAECECPDPPKASESNDKGAGPAQ